MGSYMQKMRWEMINGIWRGRWTWILYNRDERKWMDEGALDRAIEDAAGACLPPELLMHIALCARALFSDKELRSIVLVCQEWRRRCLPKYASEVKINIAELATFAQLASGRPLRADAFTSLVTDLTLRGESMYSHTTMLVPTLHHLERSFGAALCSLHTSSTHFIWHPPHSTHYSLLRNRLTALRKLKLSSVRFDSTTVLLRLLASLPSLEQLLMVDSECEKTSSATPSKRATILQPTIHVFSTLSVCGVWSAALSLCWTWPVAARQGVPRFPGMKHAEAQVVAAIITLLRVRAGGFSLQLSRRDSGSCRSHICVVLVLMAENQYRDRYRRMAKRSQSRIPPQPS